MKYLVVRRKGFVLQMRGNALQPGFPYHLATEELNRSEVLKQIAADGVKEVIPVIEFQKPKPASIQIDPQENRSVIDGATWGVRAVEALRVGKKGDTATVAVLDTGIDRQHPAFSGVDLSLSDFTSDERGVPDMAEDQDGHGTHVAATIFGRNIDGIQIGVAPGVTKALIGKVISHRGANLVTLKSALDWAINHRADIICLSLGVDFPGLVEKFENEFQIPKDIAVSRVLEAYRKTMALFDTYAASVKAYAGHQRGALLVAAAGNESRRGENTDYTVNASPPASGDGFVSVGAVMAHGQTVQVAPFSNSSPHLVAPGVSILSARLGGGLAFHSGTSMAAPHVAGVAALWIEHEFAKGDRPAGWVDRVKSRLEGSAQPIAASFSDAGYGLVQAPPS